MDNLFDFTAETVKWISSIGRDSAGGTTRLVYTDSWFEAQTGLKAKFEALGMKAQFDSVGNLFGRIEGAELPEETILSGSHIDTVKYGGKLDGQFGIIAAYIAIKYLLENYGKPKRSLEVVSFSEEEGSRFPYNFWGSKNFMGIANKEDVLNIKDDEGLFFVKEMEKYGFSYDNIKSSPRTDVKSFVEIHIEQGNVLEMNNQSLGIVTGIVGQKRFGVHLKGLANHAGTTPMGYRKDTVYGFSKMCASAIDKAKKLGDPLVLTIGKVIPRPNVPNVIAGELDFTIDCRHTNMDILSAFTEEIIHDMEKTAEELGLEMQTEMWLDDNPVPMDENIIKIITDVCKENNVNYRVMHSGAGHDSQIIAPRIPTGMIFVPSIGGISHNPAEDTKTEDLVEGIKILIGTLHKLAY